MVNFDEANARLGLDAGSDQPPGTRDEVQERGTTIDASALFGGSLENDSDGAEFEAAPLNDVFAALGNTHERRA